MRLIECKKYITWNLVSLIGYVSLAVTVIFLLMCFVASSGTTVREDVDMFFYDYIRKVLIIPYIKFYKFQFLLMVFSLVLSVFEHRYYEIKEMHGVNLFENHENGYTFGFALGISLNFVPLYLLYVIIILHLIRFI